MRGSSSNHRNGSPRRGRWSQVEIMRLRERYGRVEDSAIARELKRPMASVRTMAEKIFRGRIRSGPWSAEEVGKLKEYLGRSSSEVIARILGREPREVEAQILDLGRIQRSGRWNRQELAELKRLYGTRTDEDLGRILGRNVESIRRQAASLRLSKDKAFLRKLNGENATRMPRWSDEELLQLKEIYPHQPNLDIAKALNRSVKSVVSKAHNIGLKKEAERLREMGRTNVMLRYRGAAASG